MREANDFLKGNTKAMAVTSSNLIQFSKKEFPERLHRKFAA